MVRMKKIYWLGLVLVVGIVVALINVCLEEASKNEWMQSPVFVELELTQEPLLNKSVDIILKVTLRNNSIDISNVAIHIDIPKGFELVNGDLVWVGDLHQGDTITLQASIKAIKTGSWIIWGGVDIPDGTKEGDSLFISISNTTAKVRESEYTNH